jgi:hypothetical protein
MRIASRCAAVLLAGTIQVSAQPVQQQDPYADSYRSQQVQRYNQEVDALLDLVRQLYYADGCGVFGRLNGGAYLLYYPSYDRLYVRSAKIFGNGNHFRPLYDQIEVAKREGRARAAQPGKCDYWQQHPDKVYELRQAALAATMAQ